MPESLVQVTEGVGKKLHTWQTTIGANAVEDEFVIPGEYPYPTFMARASASIATANDHLLQLMAPASSKVRIRRITVTQTGSPAAAATAFIEVYRLTTAGTNGTAVTPWPFETTDAATALARSLTNPKGTEGTQLLAKRLTLLVAAPTTPVELWTWMPAPGSKPLIIPAGAANGIAIKSTVAVAATTLECEIEFIETTF